MLKSYDYITENLKDELELGPNDNSRSINSLSPLEFTYLNEVKDLPDVYMSRLEELGVKTCVDSCCIDGKFNNNIDSYPEEEIVDEIDSVQDYGSGTPLDSERGQWEGERGNSAFVFNPESKPSSKNYGNLKDLTYSEMGKDLGDTKPQVEYVKGNPVFDRDGGTVTGRPLEVRIEEGIDKFLNSDELKNGAKINREQLHTEAFIRMADKYGVSVEELKVFKGDSEPIQVLSEKWHCTEEEVWVRCGNPNHIQRVFHEDKDQITIQLVPRMYHDNVTHSGGIEQASRAIREKQ